MGLTISESGGGADFKPCPEGTHVARCVRVIDLGMQPGSAQYPDPKHKVMITWEVPGELVTVGDETVPVLVSERFTASLSDKAKLRALLHSWRGRNFTEEELKGFALKNILDVPCMITVVHSTDGKWANVLSVAKMPKGIPAPARISDLVHYEIEDGTNHVYNALSEKLRATIDIGAGRSQGAPTPAPAPGPSRHDEDQQRRGGTLASVTNQPTPANAPPPDDDDWRSSVPF